MATYRTPDVYVTQTRSVQRVVQEPTAVPAFIGCTEHGPVPDDAGDIVAVVGRFTSLSDYEAQFGGPFPRPFTFDAVGDVHRGQPAFEHTLYDCLRLFYANGGRTCYVISIGTYENAPVPAHFRTGLDALAREDEPTLILLPEAIGLGPSHYYELAREALAQCAGRRDRFAILDVIDDRPLEEFREGVGEDNLTWGAAYHPYLRTTLTSAYTEDSVHVGAQGVALADVEDAALRERVTGALARQFVTLPASAAVAGVYAYVDGQRGVWAAPAGISLAQVTAPTIALTDAGQVALNGDASGKWINVIRALPPRGIVVWGTRTLAGDDPQWRYVPTRRLMSTIEASVVASTRFAAFEPNGAATWRVLTAMVEDYLNVLWRAGAMAGPTPASSYFVKVGLGSSMTSQDVVEGRLVIELGVAAVNPADFLRARITHSLGG